MASGEDRTAVGQPGHSSACDEPQESGVQGTLNLREGGTPASLPRVDVQIPVNWLRGNPGSVCSLETAARAPVLPRGVRCPRAVQRASTTDA